MKSVATTSTQIGGAKDCQKVKRIMNVRKALLALVVLLLCGTQALAVVDEELQGNQPVESQVESQVASVSVTELPIVRTIPLPGTLPYGLAFDGTCVWHSDSGNDRIYRLDPADGTVLDSSASPASHPTGLGWYEGNLGQWHGLWNCDYDTDRIYHVVDPLHSIPAPGSSPNGVVWIEDALWVSYFGSGQLHQIDPSDGHTLGTMPAPGTSIRGMTMWEGDLWAINSNRETDVIYRLNPSDGTILGAYLPEGFTPGVNVYICGLAAVGEELWVLEKYSRQALVLVPEPPTIEAAIDIDPDTLNLKSKGRWITCYIWLPEGYDVADIDCNSVWLEEVIAADWMSLEDEEQVAMVKFNRSEVQDILGPGEVELTVSGELTDGTRFEGTDTITIIDKGNSR